LRRRTGGGPAGSDPAGAEFRLIIAKNFLAQVAEIKDHCIV